MSAAPTHDTPLQVFVVENHPDTLCFFRMYLQQAGHQVRQAQTLAEAAAALAAEGCDVLISDLGLPDGSGWDLLRRLRDEHHEPPYAIAISGYGTSADRARSRDAGFRHHLLKPFDLEELDRLLEEAGRTVGKASS